MIDEKIFPFLAEKGHVISLVGGGGKTTLMYNLAANCARKGWQVLAATTTHIMQPPGGVWAQTDAELFRLWKCGSYAVAGTAAPGGKLTAPPQAQLERWMTLADIVLIEADGAKRMPCSRPPSACTRVRFGLMGVPQSTQASNSSSFTSPVSVSTSTSAAPTMNGGGDKGEVCVSVASSGTIWPN